jgi:hypothetical protein
LACRDHRRLSEEAGLHYAATNARHGVLICHVLCDPR